MKALAIGDFHGKCSFSIKKIVKDNNIDFILCTGDLCNADRLRTLIFRHWELLHLGFDLSDIIGRKYYRSLVEKAIKSQDKVLKKLEQAGVPVYMVWGNNDYPRKVLKNEPYKHTPLEKKLKKYRNIMLLHRRIIKRKDFHLVGISGYKGNFLKKKTNLEKIKSKLRGIKRNNIILLMHEPPRGVMDKVKWKKSPMHGEHVGNKQNLELMKKIKPGLFIFGHMHENQGRKKIKNTVLVNHGPAFEKKYAVLDLKNRKVSLTK